VLGFCVVNVYRALCVRDYNKAHAGLSVERGALGCISAPAGKRHVYNYTRVQVCACVCLRGKFWAVVPVVWLVKLGTAVGIPQAAATGKHVTVDHGYHMGTTAAADGLHSQAAAGEDSVRVCFM
jgi:hypothetical protein